MHLNEKYLKYISKTCLQKYQNFLMLFWPHTTSKPIPNSSFPSPFLYFSATHRPNSNQTYEFWWLYKYRNLNGWKWAKSEVKWPNPRSADSPSAHQCIPCEGNTPGSHPTLWFNVSLSRGVRWIQMKAQIHGPAHPIGPIQYFIVKTFFHLRSLSG
jgi:hypothetical protein